MKLNIQKWQKWIALATCIVYLGTSLPFGALADDLEDPDLLKKIQELNEAIVSAEGSDRAIRSAYPLIQKYKNTPKISQDERFNSLRLNFEKATLIQGLVAAAGSHDRRLLQGILDKANRLVSTAGLDPKDADDIRKEIIDPLTGVLEVDRILGSAGCKKQDKTKAISEEFQSTVLSQYAVCSGNQLKTTATIEKLGDHVDEIVHSPKIKDLFEEERTEELKPILRVFADQVYQKSKENLITLYYQVYQKYTGDIPKEGTEAIKALSTYQAKSDSKLEKELESLAQHHPTEIKRMIARAKLFYDTRKGLKRIAEYNHELEESGRDIAISERLREGVFRGRDTELYENEPVHLSRGGRTPYSYDDGRFVRGVTHSDSIAIQSVMEALNGRPDSPLYFNVELEETPVIENLMQVCMERRYGVRYADWGDSKNPFLSFKTKECQTLIDNFFKKSQNYRLFSKEMTDQFLKALDMEMQRHGFNLRRGGEAVKIVSDPHILSDSVKNAYQRARIRIGSYVLTPEEFAQTRYARTTAEKEETIQKMTDENPLTWQWEIRNLYSHGLKRGFDEKSLPDEKLNQLLNKYYHSVKTTIKKLDELYSGDPADFIKKAIQNYPSVVGQVLAEHPEMASLVCELSSELYNEEKLERIRDTVFTAVGMSIAGGLALMSGGLSLAGFGTAAAIAGGVGTVAGAGFFARNAMRTAEKWDDARTAELFLISANQGDPEEVRALIADAQMELMFSVLEGGLTALDAGLFFKALKALPAQDAKKVLEQTARGSHNADGIRRLKETRFYQQNPHLFHEIDSKKTTADSLVVPGGDEKFISVEKIAADLERGRSLDEITADLWEELERGRQLTDTPVSIYPALGILDRPIRDLPVDGFRATPLPLRPELGVGIPEPPISSHLPPKPYSPPRKTPVVYKTEENTPRIISGADGREEVDSQIRVQIVRPDGETKGTGTLVLTNNIDTWENKPRRLPRTGEHLEWYEGRIRADLTMDVETGEVLSPPDRRFRFRNGRWEGADGEILEPVKGDRHRLNPETIMHQGTPDPFDSFGYPLTDGTETSRLRHVYPPGSPTNIFDRNKFVGELENGTTVVWDEANGRWFKMGENGEAVGKALDFGIYRDTPDEFSPLSSWDDIKPLSR